MSSRHSLALPLSAGYAQDSHDGFSFYTTTTTTTSDDQPGLLHPTVERYLDDLCGFLRAARLIQAHPDNYFQFMRGETWAASAVHFDGSPVEAQELADTQRLLRGFGPLLRGEDAMAKLRTLVRDGPPPCAAVAAAAAPSALSFSSPSSSSPQPSTAHHGDLSTRDAEADSLRALNEFYAMTRTLMVSRTRRPRNDAATCTLLSPAEAAALDRASVAAQARQRHQEQILELVVSHGMNPKKQHEVRIMRDTIHDLVDCCNASTARADEDRVQTVINLGEGKGYVSRAVALCDNLQVVGLDCNPAHKERAVERIESLLETSLSSRDGRPRVNLLYEPRGHVASIACRVEESVDWTQLLEGHVLTRPDTCTSPKGCSCACGTHLASEDETNHDDAFRDSGSGAGDATNVLSRTRGEESVKLACRACGKVVRLENTTVIMKHVYTHLHSSAASPSSSSAHFSIPSLQQLHEWNLQLSQHAFVAKLTEIFFTVTDVEARHRDNRKDAALLKRPREAHPTGGEDNPSSSSCADKGEERAEGEVQQSAETSCLTLTRAPAAALHTPEASRAAWVTLQPTHTARGYRAVLLLARPVASSPAALREGCTTLAPPSDENKDSTNEDVSEGPVQALTDAAAQSIRYAYTQVVGTIVGYDGGVDCHQVCLDGEQKKRVLRLYRIPQTSTELAENDNNSNATCTSEGEQRAGTDQPLWEEKGSTSPLPVSTSSYTVGDWVLPSDPALWARQHVAVVLSVLPPALPSTPTVLVPSIRNTVLIGLHPCGDLGSNVCRIFTQSAARGLLLVSCCWHALTPAGFPLSHALRRRGMTTDSVSLLLATQPLDAWSTASPEGHRSSARLLFYRSLFKLLWAQLAREWPTSPQRSRCDELCGIRAANVNAEEKQTCVCAACCEFPAAPPHLEPVFLRKMTRQKDTLTFVEFMDAIAAEYIYKESAKDTIYTPWNIGQRCAACREKQESYVREAIQERKVAASMAAEFETTHFAQFLGLTVLRMWMCHLVESLLLLDRSLYLHEELSRSGGAAGGEDSAVSLVPLFDGALSPRMYGVLARRGGSACV